MKKFAVCALIIGLVAVMAVPSFAWDAAKQKALGQDKNKMTCYILDYGKDANGIPFAVSRKYYTNQTIKNETIELLMSKFGLSPEKAGSLYFTEYGYEYTPDGKQFAMTYQRHYDMLGNEIYGTVFDDSSETTKKNFIQLSAVAGQTPAKAAPYALGKPVATPKATPAKKAPAKKSSTVPAKRVVHAKKGN
ncbi:MAG: hypothetical protein IJG36_00320 [Synergistaceae bacterium]|nr:hypothetical protein [Synergistaceae bacterium]